MVFEITSGPGEAAESLGVFGLEGITDTGGLLEKLKSGQQWFRGIAVDSGRAYLINIPNRVLVRPHAAAPGMFSGLVETSEAAGEPANPLED